MPGKKVTLSVKLTKSVKGRPTSYMKKVAEAGSLAEIQVHVETEISKGTPYFEVDHGDGFKTRYSKPSYEQNFNKKLIPPKKKGS